VTVASEFVNGDERSATDGALLSRTNVLAPNPPTPRAGRFQEVRGSRPKRQASWGRFRRRNVVYYARITPRRDRNTSKSLNPRKCNQKFRSRVIRLFYVPLPDLWALTNDLRRLFQALLLYFVVTRYRLLYLVVNARENFIAGT